MRIVIPNQPSGTNLIIKARSKSGAEYSEWSRNFMLTTAGDTVAPNTPANVVGSMAGDSFILSWDAVTLSSDGTPAADLARYDVYVTSSGSIQTATFSTTATKFELPYNQNIAIFGTAQNNVQMAVRAVDRAGNTSAYSATVSQTNAAPAAPTGLTGSAGVDSLDFSWNAVTDADLTGYRLYMGTTVGSQTTRIWSGNSTRVTIQSTDYSTNRYYKVVAVDVFGTESATSNVVGPLKPTSPVTVDATAPAVPTGLTATLTTATDGLSASAAVSWSAVSDSDLDSYVLAFRQFASPVNDWQYMNVDRTLTTTTIQGLVPYKNYDFRIRAKDFSANYSNWSTIYAATAPSNTAPATVTGVVVTPGKDSITVSWTESTEPDVANGTGVYMVDIATNSTFTNGLLSYRTGAPSITITGLATGTTYYARVKAVDSLGLSSASWSTTANNTTGTYPVTPLSDGNPPASSPTPTATPGIGYIFLSWTPVANADRVTYEVHAGTSSASFTTSASTKIGEIDGTTFIARKANSSGTDLAYGTNYYFRIIAKDADGSAAAGTGSAATQMAKAAIGDISATPRQLGVPIITTSATAPSSPIAGDIWNDTTTGQEKTWTGSAWSATGNVSDKYITAKATDLVTNGSGILGSNYNFATSFNYDGSDAPVGANGSFVIKTTTQQSAVIDEFIAFDPAKQYKLSFQCRQTVAGQTNTMYGFIAPFDAFNLSIAPQNYTYITNTTTTLAVALNPGDTTITLTSAANWYGTAGKNAGASGYLRNMIFWDYVDAGGKVWPVGSYSRNLLSPNALSMWADGGITGNVITLSAPYSGPAKAAGTSVSNATSGGSYIYMPSATNVVVPTTWTTYNDVFNAGVMSPASQAFTSGGGTNWTLGVPPGTAKIKVGWLLNYPAGGTGKHAVAAVSLSDSAAAQATADGKNKIIRSTSAASGTAGYVAGDLWWQIDGSNNVIAQWKYSGTAWVSEALSDGVLASLNANKIVAGSTFTQALNVKSKFTLGDATTPGIIESYNYNAGTGTGFSLSSAGLDIRSGFVSAKALGTGTMTAATITIGAGGIIQTNTGGVQITDSGIVIPSGMLDANVLKANTSFITTLNVGAGGAIQSTGYTSGGTTGFQLSNAGLVIKGSGNTIDASVLKGGTITGTTINVGAGGVLNVDSTASIKSNNFVTGSTGYSLGSAGLEVNDGTIDAKVLKTNSAVIGDLVIGRSADSVGTMRSFDYVAATTGWKIGKNFFEINQGTIRAASLQLQDSHNFMPPEYASFEFAPSFYATGAGHLTASGNNTASIVTSGAKYGTQAIRFTANSANSNFNYFGSGSADYMIPLEEGQTYILSGYVRGSGPEPFNFSIRIRGNGDGSYLTSPTVTMSTAWQRVSAAFTVPTGVGHTAGLLVNRVDFTASGQWIELDGIQLERKIANLSTPSPWRPPGMTSADGGIIRTGEIRSNTNVTVNGVSQPAWSVNMSGGAQFGDASIRGKLVVGPTTPTEFATNGNMESTSLAAFTLYANAFMATTSMVRTTTGGEVIAGTGSLKFTGTDTTSSQSSMGFEVALGTGIPDSNSINFTFNLRYLSTTTVDEQCYALVQLLDSGGVVIKSKPVVFTDNTNFIVQGGTKAASQAITVPSGYTAAKMRIVAQPRIAGTHRFIFDDISINASADLGASSVSSGNYISGGAGWKLNSSGVGEFNDITIRGIIGTASAGKRLVLGDKFDTGGLYLYSGNAYEWDNGFLNVGDDASVTLWSGYIGNTVPSTPTGSGAGGAGGMGSSYSMGYMRIGPTTGNPTEYGFDFGFARTFLIDATTGFAVSAGSGNFYISDTALASTNVTSAGTLLQGTSAGPMDITQDAQTMTLKWTNTFSSAVENKVILNTNGVTLNASAIVLQNDWTPTAALTNLKGNVTDQMMWMNRALGVPGMTGGGQIDIDSTYKITWSQRFIAISLGRGTNLGTAGYFDITMPASGTFIPGYGGAADQTTTAAGIQLNAWQALYYEIPFGSGATSQSGNFKVVSYTSDFIVPNNWIMVAMRNADSPSMVYFANGFAATPWIDLPLSGSWATFDAAGTGHRQPQYRKIGTGEVHVRGLMKHAVTSTVGTFATLPVGYRPAETEMFICYANGGSCRVDLLNTGVITLNSYQGGTGAFVSLSSIRFAADL